MPDKPIQNIIINHKTQTAITFFINSHNEFPSNDDASNGGSLNKPFFDFKQEFRLLQLLQITTMKTHSLNHQDKRKQQKVPSFLKKTYELLNDPDNNGSIRWAASGLGFVIVNQDLFSKTVLPKYFKHSNYSSFVRQLNMYNFHKIRESTHQSYFHHQYFIASNVEALSQIKRKPEKKKRKSNQSEEENSSLQSMTKKIHRIIKNFTHVSIGCNLNPSNIPQNTSPSNLVCVMEPANSEKKMKSQKNTQNVFEQEGNCSLVRLPVSESSNQLSMQIDQQQKSERHMPGVPTKQLINASKNNIFPMSVSVQNVQTSIMSIFY